MKPSSDSAEKVLAALDSEQQAAVVAPIGPVRIIAGAGTGKTRTLIHRIAYWHHKGVAPASKVLAVTFTRKSAGELRKRLLELGISGVDAQTFHSAALSQLKKYWVVGGQQVDFPEVLEGLQRYKALRYSIVQTLRYLDREKKDKRKVDVLLQRLIDAEITLIRSMMLTPERYLEDARFAPPSPILSKAEVLQILEHYENAKKAKNQIDYADALERCAKMIENVPQVASAIRSNYEHFLVDEYQDNDLVQERLLAAWLGSRQSICVVGDPRQTIFSFKGADPKILRDFPKKFPKAVTVELNQNYRSSVQITDWANRLMRSTSASGGATSELISHGSMGRRPEIRSYFTEKIEFEQLAKRIQVLKKQENLKFADFAVLMRLVTGTATVRNFLLQAGIPSKTPKDQFWKDAQPVLKGLKSIARLSTEINGEQALTLVLKELNWLGDTSQLDEMDDEHGNIGATLMALAGSIDESKKLNAESLLLAFAEQEELGKDDEELDAVTVTTFHQAKGLEWDAVYMPQFVAGVLPISHARTSDKLDEERRVAYVGITRARRFLEISWAETYKYADQIRNQNLSPFEAYLRQIQLPKVEENRPQKDAPFSNNGAQKIWEQFQPSSDTASVPFDALIGCSVLDGSEVVVGARISHPVHGLGTVDTVKNSYTIADFDRGGRFKVKFV